MLIVILFIILAVLSGIYIWYICNSIQTKKSIEQITQIKEQVEEIINAHVSIVDRPGVGTSITIGIGRPEAHVLIVDSKPDSIDCIRMKEFLINHGYKIFTARNGIEALNIIKEIKPDIVLSETVMPEMNGIQLLDIINKKYPEIVFIIFTDYGSIETAKEAMIKGAYDYIIKSTELNEIVSRIEKAIEFKLLKQKLKDVDTLIKSYDYTVKIPEKIRNDLLTDINEINSGLDRYRLHTSKEWTLSGIKTREEGKPYKH